MIPAVASIPDLGQLALVRLLAYSAKPLARSALRKSLEPFFLHRTTAAEWITLFEEILGRLIVEGLITGKPLALTERGRAQALGFLGLETLPARVSWRTLKNTYLVARALEMPAPSPEAGKRLATAEGLRALVLKQHHRLPTQDFPTLTQATDALAWKQLGLESAEPFSKGAAIAVLLGRLIGPDGKWDAKQLQLQIPARLLGARKTDAEELRLAAVRRWLDRMMAPDFSLAGFAEHVREAAQATTTGHFGPSKIFISHVWQTLQVRGTFPGMTEAEFKSRLVEANREGLLALSRADLVEAMSPDDVRESETHYLNATFHFLEAAREGP
jgi:hypothetical protein